MRVTDGALLGLVGVTAAGVLIATASGLFADPPPAFAAPTRQAPDVERAAAAVSVASAVPVQPPAAQQSDWVFPAQPDAKAARAPAGSDDLPRPAPVLAPGEQQAAWAARDKLANAASRDRPAVSPLLTRLHDGPAPGKAAAER